MISHQIKPVQSNPDFPQLEQDRLKFWHKNGVVEKYLNKNNSSKKKFFFLDGPITANGPMGVHHAWGRTYKDLWQRYANMKGFKQRFQNGFDCQGLWVEVEVEKEKKFKTKKDVENYGIDKFVADCKDRVNKFSAIQTAQSKRLGYFMDWDNSYFTMSDNNNYMIWHFLKICHQKGFIYQGQDSVPWCPRCETAISQHEMLTADYKEVSHDSIYLELPLHGQKRQYLLVWTTTPWTIPGNIAVAIDPKISYSLVEGDTKDHYWVATDLITDLFDTKKNKIIQSVKGKKLLGLKYSAPFDHLPAVKLAAKNNKFHTIIATNTRIMPISLTEGTGLVHIATSAGSEDYKLGKKYSLPTINLIKDNASYQKNLGFLSKQNAKKTPGIIFDYLKGRETNGEDWIFDIKPYKHRYPACWRCKTELVWKLADEWYIAMDKVDPDDKKKRTLRKKMMDVAKKINWLPDFGLQRELDWLKNMHDWLISKKNRYWGLALPIWVCGKCKNFDVIGSKDELQKRAVSGWKNFVSHSPHKPHIDKLLISCNCGGVMTRIPDVGNPWLDAGIVPFSTLIDPKTQKPSFSTDKKDFNYWFPADFVTESFPGQFKNWFYSLIAMSTVLCDSNPFKNILGYASVLGEDGREMHKSWGNSIEFNEAADKIGSDIMRWVFVRHNPERNLLFGFTVAEEIRRQFHLILWNSYRYFSSYASLENFAPTKPNKGEHILDQWINVRILQTINIVSNNLDKFLSYPAALEIESFVSDLSTWYIRRSRNRIGLSALNQVDKKNCYTTFFYIFETLSRLAAPFIPFVSDEIYTNLTGKESVHLSDWPKGKKLSSQELTLIKNMSLVRKICELGNAERKYKDIPTRQPLSDITIYGASNLKTKKSLLQLIKDELNIQNILFASGKDLSVALNTDLTDDLIARGEVRGIIRKVQQERKKALCRLDQKITLTLPAWPAKYKEEIMSKTLAVSIVKGDSLKLEKI